ncbi:tRNA dimethylallyltransferase [Gramella sp. Hel_I_59]|uniref:tRNA (adenosine(37)-N6)-dimethylallyltransferase MiaA n=1 Tax=Gramella sp. Hel_I_59 TaxID=1249978 RepID=UPI001150F6D6|nr:tRNA (adenosine(37)-N6)-dimethylallyltransferase MiaA [Gramella sp. Hel_I_59]TQI71448.1 tRNA dimethylallyltransferase [Gramella sp. Hel_I_59]
MTKMLINIVGPTAIGKTALSIEVAKLFDTEILSADSRQFYKEMSIGTAVPEPEELAAVNHHFIQHRSITEDYNVGDFEREALAKLDELFQEHHVVVMVGGSGLYTKAVVEGLDHFPEVDDSIRIELNEELSNQGLLSLQQKLQQMDPEYYAVADVQNPHRLIRALEICIGTGKAFSSFLKKKKNARNFETISVGLTAERVAIYDRINRRVDLMIENGLLEEARELYPSRKYNALNTVGYKELFAYFDEEWNLETAVSEIKKNTRRFAKRQLTWFRKDETITWFDRTTNFDLIAAHLQEKINS